MTVLAMISMKGHSARVPGKNLRELAGRPLYQWILMALMDAERVDEVVVETDSDEIAESVNEFCDLRVLRRPRTLCGDEVPMNDLIDFTLSQTEADVFLQTHATNPLLRAETIDRALEAYADNSTDHDSLFGVTEWKTRLFSRDGQAVNHDPDELIPTQDLEPVFEENSNLYLFTRESFAKRHHRIGITPYLFPIDRLEAVDIDEECDFELADFLMRKRLQEPALDVGLKVVRSLCR